MEVPLQWPSQEAALLQVGQGARVLGGRGQSLLLLLCPAPTVSARWQVTLLH